MNFLFIMLDFPQRPEDSNMYTDLAEEFRDNGHNITVMAPDMDHHQTFLNTERKIKVLRVRTKPIIGVNNLIKKGVGLALLPVQYKRAYKKYLEGETFDWIIMPTPPITLVDLVECIKLKTGARFYLILRDIHPQSAASIGLITNRFMYRYLAVKAKKGYKIADLIGCMSKGNIEFIASNYPEIDKSKLVLLMNWLKYREYEPGKSNLREKYDLNNKFIALFGGNIGSGQRIENIITLSRHYNHNSDIIFLVIGKGIRKEDLRNYALKEKLSNIKFIDYLPRNDYLELVNDVDVGLISINEKYAVPTCPSKAVSYMSLKIPIMAIINPENDYGSIIENAGAGFWAVGGDSERIFSLFDRIFLDSDLRRKMGENGYRYYVQNLTSEKAYTTIMNHINSNGEA